MATFVTAKRHLQDDDWQTIPIQVWVSPKMVNTILRKHMSFGYAMAVVVHMNLICEGPQMQWEVEDYRKKPPSVGTNGK